MKNMFITAYRFYFGGTKKDAEKVYFTAEPEYISEIINGYFNQIRRTFYND